uniref:Uncharacterized protein n=1 Tax=Schlesneria paludicola TaxID=360056 RepID=A0A7C2P2I4_9PLAN
MANGFLQEGFRRARAAVEPVVRQTVTAEYAERLQQADAKQRRHLLRMMKREIHRRVDEKAPRWGLY